MKKIKNTLLALLIVLSCQAFGQDSLYKHYFGFQAGKVSGYGFSYRMERNNFGFQIGTLPLFGGAELAEIVSGEENSINIGGMVSLRFFDDLMTKNYKANIFIYAGGTYTYAYTNGYSKSVKDIGCPGVGFGLERYFLPYLRINIMSGYAILIENSEANSILSVGGGIHFLL